MAALFGLGFLALVFWAIGAIWGGIQDSAASRRANPKPPKDEWPHHKDPWRTCFPPGTRVSTPGGPRSIESLRVGDSVHCHNYDTGTTVIGTITRADTSQEPKLHDFVLADDMGSISCSPSQRFYTFPAWVRTEDIRPGTHLGELAVQAIETRRWEGSVHSFVIVPHDNFIVLTDQGTQLIAHDNSS